MKLPVGYTKAPWYVWVAGSPAILARKIAWLIFEHEWLPEGWRLAAHRHLFSWQTGARGHLRATAWWEARDPKNTLEQRAAAMNVLRDNPPNMGVP